MKNHSLWAAGATLLVLLVVLAQIIGGQTSVADIKTILMDYQANAQSSLVGEYKPVNENLTIPGQGSLIAQGSGPVTGPGQWSSIIGGSSKNWKVYVATLSSKGECVWAVMSKDDVEILQSSYQPVCSAETAVRTLPTIQ